MKHKLVAAVVGLSAAALALSACGGNPGTAGNTTGGSTSTETAGGGAMGTQVLTIGMPNGSQTNNSNPFVSTSSGRSLGYTQVIYEPFAYVNDVRPTMDPVPCLATKWTWNEDYTKVDLELRDNATWSDGQPVTAEDAKYSIQLRMDHEAFNEDALPYDSVTTSGNTVTITFKSSQYVNQNKVLNLFVVPEHIWSKLADVETDLNQQPVGSGAYTLESWTPQAVTIKARTDYWGDQPTVPQVRYTSYNDNTALTTALVNGDAQWGWTFIADYENVYVNKDPEHNKYWFATGLASDVLFVNTTKAPFDNVAFRKALSMVIDRDKVSQQASSGVAPAITSVTGLPLPAGESFITSDYKDQTLKVDVEGAKKLLTDAGYTGVGTKLVDPQGNPVKFVLSNPAGWSDYLTALQIIAESAKSLGAEATVDAPNADTWLTDIAAGNFTASLHWTDSGSTPWNYYSNIMDGAQYKEIGKSAAWNYGRFKSDDATKALDEYANATDDATRNQALATIQKIFVDEQPAIPSTARPAFAEYSTKNYTGWPTEDDPYIGPDPTRFSSAKVILSLKPVS